MFETHFFETMLDNFSDGVYILDDAGNYIFVNSAYSKLLNMPKSVLLRYNVHDFLSTGQIDRCISDIVYLEKRQVVMFQDVWDTQNYGRSAIRQIVTSTPIFDEGGQVRNILAVVQPLDKLNDLSRPAKILSYPPFPGAAPSTPPPPPSWRRAAPCAPCWTSPPLCLRWILLCSCWENRVLARKS